MNPDILAKAIKPAVEQNVQQGRSMPSDKSMALIYCLHHMMSFNHNRTWKKYSAIPDDVFLALIKYELDQFD